MTSPVSFTKERADAPAGFFEAEAAGLAWLASAGGVATAQVLRVAPGVIEIEHIDEVVPSSAAARRFGAQLARTHSAGADSFGSPPEGYAGPMFIGRRPLPAADEEQWGVFYARDRILPYLEIAERVGNISVAGASAVREACALIASGDLDDDEPPSRLHGDLWNGNVLWSEGGVVLIDPAAHGGHRETDLAMLALFGCAHLDEILEGYERVYPLRAGWEDRVALHQLHPLAVHAAGHGPGYGLALQRAAEQVLASEE